VAPRAEARPGTALVPGLAPVGAPCAAGGHPSGRRARAGRVLARRGTPRRGGLVGFLGSAVRPPVSLHGTRGWPVTTGDRSSPVTIKLGSA